jgi:hypothetical protein
VEGMLFVVKGDLKKIGSTLADLALRMEGFFY